MKYVLLLCISFIMVSAYSQESGSVITQKKKKYYQGTVKLKKSELKSILINNPASAVEGKLWKKNYNIASGFMYAGAVSVFAAGVVSLTSTLDEKNELEEGDLSNSTSYSFKGLGFAALGLVFVGVSIPFNISAKKHLRSSVSQYNSSLNQARRKPKVNFEFIVSSQGMPGIRMRF